MNNGLSINFRGKMDEPLDCGAPKIFRYLRLRFRRDVSATSVPTLKGVN